MVHCKNCDGECQFELGRNCLCCGTGKKNLCKRCEKTGSCPTIFCSSLYNSWHPKTQRNENLLKAINVRLQ